jgi:GT2 family glycosyltransferase/SAM-dependent methyltransferase
VTNEVVQSPVRSLALVPDDLGYFLLRDVGSRYADGSEADLLELVNSCDDPSSLSDELMSKAVGWAERYHVDPARANVLRSLNLPDDAHVLEVGAGCGAVTRYLGEVCAAVDALEPVASRAAVAHARTRDQESVSVFVGEIADIPAEAFYDLVVVTGVMEYVGHGDPDSEPYARFLSEIRRRLVRGGSLILTIENRLGVKYLVGAPEDHTNVVFDSVEGYPVRGKARTFSRAELTRLATDAGFSPSIKSVFPDYKVTRAVIDGFPEMARSLHYRIPQFPSPDWLDPRPKLADEYSVWRTMVEADLQDHFANSFLLLAHNGEPNAELWPAGRSATFFSVGRRAKFGMRTDVDSDSDSVTFRRRALVDPPAAQDSPIALVESIEAYVVGDDLIDVFARDSTADIGAMLKNWLLLLDREFAAGHPSLDLVPHNLVVTAPGELDVIDIELNSPGVSREQVVRRGIYWLAQRLAGRCSPRRWPGVDSVRDLAVALGVHVGLDAAGGWIDRAVLEEIAVQAEARPFGGGIADRADHETQIRSELEQNLEIRLSDGPLGSRLFEGLPALARYADTLEQERDAAREAHRNEEEQRKQAVQRVADIATTSRAIDAQVHALRSESSQLQLELSAAQQDKQRAEQWMRKMELSRINQIAAVYRHGVEKAMPVGTRRRAAYHRALRSHSPHEVPGPPAITLATSTAPTLSILIPVHGKWEYTRSCLLALAEHPIATPYEVVIVDDASPDETRARLAEVRGIRTVLLDQNVGFLGACNSAFPECRGEFVLLLNNDAEVRPGAVDALVETAREPQVGAVGARLVYPDGTLQEAGGIIFSDGNGWNFGRNADAEDWRYNYRRSVDYCSGAALLVRTDLLRELGGFDTRFTPAYYEDTDLCFAIRAKGFDVVYDPRATVVHHEGVSHGVELSGGTKAFQEINRLKFVEKWRDKSLASQPPNDEGRSVPRSVWRHKRGLVVIIDHYVPRPDEDSGSKRQVALIKRLIAMNYGIIFVPANRFRSEPYCTQLQAMGVEVIYGHVDVGARLVELSADIKLAIVARPDVGWGFLPILRALLPQLRIAYDTVDLHYLREQRHAELTGDPGLHRRAEVTKQSEFGLIRSSDLTLVVSAFERDVLQREIPEAQVEVLSNVHQTEVDFASPEGRADLMFVGSFTHTPNEDAVLWFVESVLPLIRERRPDVRFNVVGHGRSERVTALQGGGVKLLGWVPDLVPIYARARVVVAPLRYGAGVKGKIGESLAHGVPVVTTPVGAEGMGLVDGKTARIAVEPREFADAVLDLLEDDQQWSELSAAGLSHIDEMFGADVADEVLARLLDESLT